MTDKRLDLTQLMATNHDDSNLLGRRRLAGLSGLQFEGDRDIYDVAGYEESLTFRHYLDQYKRQPLAKRVVDMPARTTWRNEPEVVEVDANGEPVEGGEFNNAFNELGREVRLWHMLERMDRMAGIGEFGVLFLGVPGPDMDLSNEIPNDLGLGDLLFLSAFHQGHVDVKKLVDDPTDPRHGLPASYEITFGSNHDGGHTEQVEVHHSRVIHVADNLLENDVFGHSRLEPVFNRLYDLEKMDAATAESYWQLAARIFQVKIDEDFDISDSGMDDIDEQMEELMHDLRRHVQWKGADIEVLEGNEPDPTNPAAHVIQEIAAGAGIPKRILMGSERGELASTQDKSEWLARISERQTRFAEPGILRPLIERLQMVGILPEANVDIQWPNLFELSEMERAETAASYAKAVKDLAPAGMTDQLVTVGEARQFLNLPEERPDAEELDQFRREEDEASAEEANA